MKKTFLLIAFLLLGNSVFAQHNVKAELIPTLPNESYVHEKSDTLKILAIMVQFQPDRYDATYGDGTFGSIYTGENRTRTDILDPLPHDKNYFENHLRFVKNYFEKESGGKLHIVYEVLPQVITLDNTMRNYSPEVNSTDLTTVANLTKEAWQKAYNENPNFNFSSYDMFIVFHAGVGRDVSVPGSLGLERDIPSVFLGLKQYQEIFGNDFDGIPIGNFKITNTAVLPETESREVAGITGSVLIELTTNGLLASMVGSFLGLPDLYNTDTGLSAIGRFGLMDGQAIFAYGGAFPPSLSPYEKMLLGWIEPVTINTAGNVRLFCESIANIGDTTLAKFPINKSEYFLVQVRRRDANSDGAKIHYVDENGTTRQLVFETDTTGFYNYDVSALQGVIVNVDEFDWALPGEGIVIWHIDENKVREGIENNTVNNDINHRGVAVVEADGVNDIGKTFHDIFGDLVVGEGTYFDFWYKGNGSHFYINEFTPESKPASVSYYGTPSNIYLTNFSEIGNSMTFNADFHGDIEIVNQFKLPNNETPDFITSSNSQDNLFFGIKSGSNVYIYDFAGNLLKELNDFSATDFLLEANAQDSSYAVYGAKGNSLYEFESTTDNLTELALFENPVKKIFAENGTIYVLTNTENSSEIFSYENGSIQSIATFHFKANDAVVSPNIIAVGDSVLAKSGSAEFYYASSNIKHFASVNYLQSQTNKNLNLTVLLESGNLFEIINTNDFSLFSLFNPQATDTINDFSITLSPENQPLISFSADGKLYLYNVEGAIYENFPQTTDYGNYNDFVKTYQSRNENIFVATADNGNLYFQEVESIPNQIFPVYSLGNYCSEIAKVTLANYSNSLYLIFPDCQNNIYILKKQGKISSIVWSGKYANSGNSSALSISDSSTYSNNNAIIKAYNWPNPVSEGVTHFRLLTPEDANVVIKIFDLSGMKIDELTSHVSANFEKDIDWNIGNIQSDVYFAHVEVTLASGKKASKLIKVAVVR